MLGSIRKFSKTFLAKIFIAIIALPFILWGMGDIFRSGKQNILAEINDEVISSKEFIGYIQKIELSQEQIESLGKPQILENILSNYLSEKIIEIESEAKGIMLTDKGLKNIIVSDKSFEKEKKFSRVKYEKFLLKNGYSAPTYEKYIKGLEVKAQLLNLYSGGIKLPNFIIEDLAEKENHSKQISYLNLNNIYSKKIIGEKEIKKFYEDNKELFKERFISFRFLELTPEVLIKNKDYNELFYQKLDELENEILDGKTFLEITAENKNNIQNIEMVNIRKTKKDGIIIENLSDELFNEIFKISQKNLPRFINLENKFYIVEVVNQENMFLTLDDENLKKTIKTQIDIMNKVTENKKIIDEIDNKKFTKINMNKLASKNNIKVENLNINGLNDDRVLSKDIVQKIYNHSENEIFLVTDNLFKKNYLVNIDKDIPSKNTNKEDIKKYSSKANAEYVSNIYKSYDRYINTKYKIDINEKVLERLKNSF